MAMVGDGSYGSGGVAWVGHGIEKKIGFWEVSHIASNWVFKDVGM